MRYNFNNYSVASLEYLIAENSTAVRYFPLIPQRSELILKLKQAGYEYCDKYCDDFDADTAALLARTGLAEQSAKLLRGLLNGIRFMPKSLRELEEVDAELVCVLKTRGVKDSGAFLECYCTMGADSLAESYGVSTERVRYMAALCDLMRLPGVKLVRASLYYDSGFNGAKSFADYDAQSAQERIRAFVECTGSPKTVSLPKELSTQIAVSRALPALIPDADELHLTRACDADEDEAWAYRKEFFDYRENHVNGSSGMHNFTDFTEWQSVVKSLESNPGLDGTTANTYFTRRGDGRIVGSIQLRHRLTPTLEEHGGNIGYCVRPTERGKGYGKAQLVLVLNKARAMGLTGVMIDCDTSNRASTATILSCGGRLVRNSEYKGVPQSVFWVEL